MSAALAAVAPSPAHDLRAQLLGMRAALDRHALGMSGARLEMALGEPLPVSAADPPPWRRCAPAVRELLTVPAQLYRRSLHEEAWAWLRPWFEDGHSPEAVALSRWCADRERPPAPVPARPDFISDSVAAEIQVQGTGQGLHHALVNLAAGRAPADPSPLSAALAAGFQAQAGRQRPRVLLLAPQWALNETGLLGEVLATAHDVPASVMTHHQLRRCATVDDWDVIAWRGSLSTCLTVPALWPLVHDRGAWPRLLRLLAPAPWLPPLAKLNQVLPYLPACAELFSPAARALLPPTQPLTATLAAELLARPKRERRAVVLKYLGPLAELNWGARGVLLLGGSDDADRALLERACAPAAWPQWIAQPRVLAKYQVRFLDASGELGRATGLSRRLNPLWVPTAQGDLAYAGAICLYARHWKCHGGPQAIICGVREE